MSWSIGYTQSLNFTNGIDIQELRQYINTNSNVTPTLDVITIKGDDVTLTFDAEVLNNELTSLNNLIANYKNEVFAISSVSYLPITTDEIGNDSYEKIASFSSFSGLNATINQICLLVDIDKKVTEFTIKLIERHSGDVYMEVTFTDMSKSGYCLTNVPQLPLTESIMELYCKKKGGKKKDYVKIFAIYLLL